MSFFVKEFDLIAALEYETKTAPPTFPEQQRLPTFQLNDLFKLHIWSLQVKNNLESSRRMFSVAGPVVKLDDGEFIEIKSRKADSVEQIIREFEDILANTTENIYVLSISSVGVIINTETFEPTKAFRVRYAVK